MRCSAVTCRAIWLVMLVGCQQSDLPLRAPVEGIVTLDGVPLPRGTVTFVPDRSWHRQADCSWRNRRYGALPSGDRSPRTARR